MGFKADIAKMRETREWLGQVTGSAWPREDEALHKLKRQGGVGGRPLPLSKEIPFEMSFLEYKAVTNSMLGGMF